MRVSLLLPVASAAFAAAGFIVIPDEQTVKLVASNNHQAPLTSDDKQKIIEPEKPIHDGKPCHEKGEGHHHDVLHPQYILRGRYAERNSRGVPSFDASAIEFNEFGPAGIIDSEGRFEPSDFFHFYRSPGEPDHRHGGPHGGPHPGPYPGPHDGPRRGPPRGPPPHGGPHGPPPPRGGPHGGPHWAPHEGPHRLPEDGPWPPKPPGPPGKEPPHRGPPPREPGEPGDRPPPRWGPPPREPGEPGDEPPHRGPPGPPGRPDDRLPPPPPHWPPRGPGGPDDTPPPPPPRGPGGPDGKLPPPPPPPHWPPREPGEPGDRLPPWPPRRPGEPGEPGDEPHPPPPPPHWPPKEPGERPPPHWPPREPGEPGKRPKHPPPPHRGWKPHPPNATIWQLISKSNHTSKFAEIVSEHEDIVAILNSTIANYTLFVPTNHAFEKFKKAPKDWKPPKDLIKKFVTYHISNGAYPVFKLLLGHTIPSALDGGEIGGSQRIRVALSPGGLTVNFYSRVVAGNIFATNGVIHAVDSILIPPPPAGRIIHFFPSEFSTFLLAVHLTNLTQEIPHEHTGGTLFAPPNSAFQKLGPKINGFLFSPWGRKYLKALLKYHIVLNETLYSDAYYHPSSTSEAKTKDIPKGHYHVDLPTLLENKHLSIDISRFGGLITILINAQSSVQVQDVIAKDGVIQVVGNVLIPPKKPPTGDLSAQEAKDLDNTEDIENTMGMTVQQFRDRFEGLVEDDGVTGEYNEDDVLTMW
ncbi:hypothetical protein TWF481_006508 [Arthrobotrys musiformis]|uniref:FAS1 domain-containing protein n=1 Tax=Arthrobotrys musiformis TaxID=47236 RepID=A0AAV9WB24_9PEZI